ncbi:MAG TPA: DUF305 domain-containing protein [Allosphingosinicella sp.]|nr:DUF305 domain-containing protein [Allosphingosinicella sp.]
MKRPMLILLALLAVVVGATLLYFAQRDRGRASAPSAPPSGPSSELVGAMHRMHETTNALPMTGDIDQDFAALMIPHHRSAVEMARVYLKHGKDPQLRRLSETVIASQEAEIRQLRGRGAASVAGAHPDH